MSDQHPRSFPPLGDESRFDAILTRGRRLRRRRQIGVGAGASSAVAATAIAVVLLAGVPAPKNDDVVADENTTTTTTIATTTTTSTTTTSVVLPSTTMTIRVDQGAGSTRIVVTDTAQPVATADDEPAEQCVLARLTNSDGVVAEEFGCTDPADPAADTPIQLENTDPEIGCAVKAVRAEPIERARQEVTASFELAPPASLTAGEYELTIEAVSGIGDGCLGTTPGSSEFENSIVTVYDFTIP